MPIKIKNDSKKKAHLHKKLCRLKCKISSYIKGLQSHQQECEGVQRYIYNTSYTWGSHCLMVVKFAGSFSAAQLVNYE